MYINTSSYINISIHDEIHKYMYIYVYVCIHTHIHICTLIFFSSPLSPQQQQCFNRLSYNVNTGSLAKHTVRVSKTQQGAFVTTTPETISPIPPTPALLFSSPLSPSLPLPLSLSPPPLMVHLSLALVSPCCHGVAAMLI